MWSKMRRNDETVSGFMNRIGERLYGTCVRYVHYQATTWSFPTSSTTFTVFPNEVSFALSSLLTQLVSILTLFRSSRLQNPWKAIRFFFWLFIYLIQSSFKFSFRIPLWCFCCIDSECTQSTEIRKRISGFTSGWYRNSDTFTCQISLIPPVTWIFAFMSVT